MNRFMSAKLTKQVALVVSNAPINMQRPVQHRVPQVTWSPAIYLRSVSFEGELDLKLDRRVTGLLTDGRVTSLLTDEKRAIGC
jgi:hypothetical protein